MTDTPLVDVLHRAIQAERRGHFTAALDLLREAVHGSDQPRSLDAALRLAKLALRMGPPHHAEAEAVLTTARQEARRQGSPRQEASAIHLLALLRYHNQRLDDAWHLLEDSPVLKQVSAPGPEMPEWLHYRGLITAARGEPANAERLYFRAYQCYQEVNDEAGLAEVCDSLANLLLRRGKTRPALRFAENGLRLKRKLGDRYGEAVSLGTRGRIEQQLARYDEARQSFAEDLAIARELGDQRGIGIMLNSLGETALLRKDLAAAEQHFRENLGDERGPLNAFFARAGLARVHLSAGRLDEAEETCRQMEELLARYAELAGLTDAAIGLRGALAWRRQDYEQGERLLRQAIDELRRRNHDLDTIPFLYELRDLYQQRGALDRAVAVMVEALELWSECGAERGIDDVEDWLRTVDRPALVRLALERQLPSPLVQDVLDGKLVPPRPRLQRLTVLFSDLRDFTSLSEQIDPVELLDLLNEWFSEATRAVRHHGGLVDKFIGDAVMALFGVPDERDDDAGDAVRASLEMRDALAALNLRQKALGRPALRIGIGIDTGTAVMGFIGSHLRQSYTAIGDLVNTASRLESATKDFGCDILISQAAQDGQERYSVAETSFLGQVKVKGKQREVAVYQVRGLRGQS